MTMPRIGPKTRDWANRIRLFMAALGLAPSKPAIALCRTANPNQRRNTIMSRDLIVRLWLCVVLVSAGGSTLAAGTPGNGEAGPFASARQWSDHVWQSAMGADRESLERCFRSIPEDAAVQEAGARFRESFELYLSNADKARHERDEAREKAKVELRQHIDGNELSKALRAAVTVQTLSDDLEAAFDNPDILEVIRWAQEKIPTVEADLDWLLAQELLYFVRTLFEDTSRFEDYQKYDKQLNAVNRRVSLIAQYAPHRLHELRARRALRMGDKPLGEFKPLNADWRGRNKDVRVDMLRQALKTAAFEHIEGCGWRPLIRGGLEELRLLATTASLDETFPKLADPDLVAQWVAHIDRELAALEQTADEDLTSRRLTNLVSDLDRVNLQTIQVDREVLYREFGDGALYELDEFSEIIWPDKLSRFKQATEGAFVGVGILIRHNDTQEIIVVNPLEGTPAYFGGVKPNDKIAEVDGESTVGWSLNDAVDRITGTKKTKVTLGLQREGIEDIVPITLQRDEIKLRSVMGWSKRNLRPDGVPEWDWYIDPVSRIAYIKLTQFTDDSHSDLLEAWREISRDGKPAGLILDLRYNPGGLLTSAVQISNLFVREGVIVSGENKDGTPAWADQKADPTRAKIAEAGVPTVVLINQGSASASEIVAGCLQAHGAGAVVGERSFGKGSVQTVHPTAANARLKLTTQYYRLPATPEELEKGQPGRLVHKKPNATVWGVDPNIIVKMTPQQATKALEIRQKHDIIPRDEHGKLMPESPERGDVNQLLSDGVDPQLQTALLILQARGLGLADGAVRQAATVK